MGWESWPRPLPLPSSGLNPGTTELCSYSRWGQEDLVAPCLRNYCAGDIEFSPAGFQRLDLSSRGRLSRAQAESLCGLEGGTEAMRLTTTHLSAHFGITSLLSFLLEK